MFGMELLRSICYFEKEKGEHGHHEGHEKNAYEDDE
jgi:hypothetical protein